MGTMLFFMYLPCLGRPGCRDPFKAPSNPKHRTHHTTTKQRPKEPVIKLLGISCANKNYGALVKIDTSVEQIEKGSSIAHFNVSSISKSSIKLVRGKKHTTLTLNQE